MKYSFQNLACYKPRSNLETIDVSLSRNMNRLNATWSKQQCLIDKLVKTHESDRTLVHTLILVKVLQCLEQAVKLSTNYKK